MNTKNTTYNNIIDSLSCVSLAHMMVHSVSTGDIENIDTSGVVKYPLVHIVPTAVTSGVNTLTYDFNILAMDLVQTDESNEQDVLSDTLGILTDIIAQYKQGANLGIYPNNKGVYAQVDDSDFSLEPFTERFDNIVSGWNCNFSITMPHNYQTCNPFKFTWDEEGGEIINGTATDCTIFIDPLSKLQLDQ
tara:strand:- start:61 stop:630 length:570 start_codon:yes stop_codon:yes gene_type:complete